MPVLATKGHSTLARKYINGSGTYLLHHRKNDFIIIDTNLLRFFKMFSLLELKS